MTITKRLLGTHMSIAGGLYKAFSRGEEAGCTAMQIFTKNQSQWAAKPIDSESIEKFHSGRERTGIATIAHAAYLPNLASPDNVLWQKSFDAMLIEMERCDLLNIPNLIFHPGSCKSDTRENGVRRVGESLRKLYDAAKFDVALTIENTAGTGSNLGYRFEEIAEIIAISGIPGRLKVCFDTCHAFAAGYDIRTKESYLDVWRRFDETIGIEKLAAIHLNDSKHELGSRKDRHEHIGEGFIGLEGFRNIMNDPKLAHLPMVLETPKGLKTRDGSDIAMDKVNLKRLRDLIEN